MDATVAKYLAQYYCTVTMLLSLSKA